VLLRVANRLVAVAALRRRIPNWAVGSAVRAMEREAMNSDPKRIHGFFTYTGGKWRLAKEYYAPLFPKIVEPFAGSAGYAGKYYWLDVKLYDINPIIVGVWDYIIRASTAEINRLPLNVQDTRKLTRLPQEARWLIGFWMQRGLSNPRETPCSWMRSGNWSVHFWGPEKRARIARQAELIRHWQIKQLSWERIPNTTATWFVDPPYKRGGTRYEFNHIDYERLASWCRKRNGEVIVCERSCENWLPFKPLAQLTTVANSIYEEGFWYRGPWKR
jgi:site-specific DNA-adenine methylase